MKPPPRTIEKGIELARRIWLASGRPKQETDPSFDTASTAPAMSSDEGALIRLIEGLPDDLRHELSAPALLRRL